MKQSARFPKYQPSKNATRVLRSGSILAEKETPQAMVERVVKTLFLPEQQFGTDDATVQKMTFELATYIANKMVIPGTPLLTNAGRHTSSPLTSCVVIPVDLRDKSEAARVIKRYYKQNMGSGFDFTEYTRPVHLLKWINQLSASETATGAYDRYIGNMGSLSVYHPKIEAFIDAKRNQGMRHFNISICIDEPFMKAALAGENIRLTDGRMVNAASLLQRMAENAHFNADPGLLFMDRMNMDNPVEAMYDYVCTPPCAEMGLSKGETCQFGYINISKFVIRKNGKATIDYPTLEKVVVLVTRILDNAVEYSLSKFPKSDSTVIARYKRKIGIGVCGLADMLIEMNLPYTSEAARFTARDVLSFINYISKVASVELAEERGSCDAMMDKRLNKYFTAHFLEKKYAKHPTRTVSGHQWIKLAHYIRTSAKLRNILTTALPPTGRAALLVDATSSIEPIFGILDAEGNLLPVIERYLDHECKGMDVSAIKREAIAKRSFQNIARLPPHIKECLKTAKEITPTEHLTMVGTLAGLNGVVDEAASKTVNLESNATVEDVKNIFIYAYKNGLKNASVYRDGSHNNQPTQL